MKRRVAIFIACWVFAAGIIIASYLPKGLLLFGLYYFIAALIFLLIAIWFWHKKNTRAIFLWAAFLFFGIWRFAVSLPVDSPDKIFYYNGNKFELIGVVAAEPVSKGGSQKLEIKSLAINKSPLLRGVPEGRGVLNIEGKILVVTSAYPQYSYGDVLKINCKLERPPQIKNFDYEKYLAAQGIYSTCGFPKISLLKAAGLPPEILNKEKSLARFNWLWSGIYKIRGKLSATIDNGLAEPEAGLLKAFILNDPTVPDDLNLSFRQSGLSHIVAISGSHISLVIAIIFFCLLFFGLNRQRAFWVCVPLIIFYVVMVGAPASATRAGIMGFLVLLAMYFGRLSRLDYILALAGLAMLIFNPMLVIADAGFQLSFLAVLGMIYLYPVFDKWLSRLYEEKITPIPLLVKEGRSTNPVRAARPPLPGRGLIKIICQTAALTIAAQVFTAPILIFGFHQISLVAPIANLFALWAAPFIMISAFIAMALSAIIPVGALIFFLPTDLLAKYLIAVAQISASLPFAYWKF
jgi:competence protein ComEC